MAGPEQAMCLMGERDRSKGKVSGQKVQALEGRAGSRRGDVETAEVKDWWEIMARGQRGLREAKALALHVTDPGSVPGLLERPLSIVGSDS